MNCCPPTGGSLGARAWPCSSSSACACGNCAGRNEGGFRLCPEITMTRPARPDVRLFLLVALGVGLASPTSRGQPTPAQQEQVIRSDIYQSPHLPLPPVLVSFPEKTKALWLRA